MVVLFCRCTGAIQRGPHPSRQRLALPELRAQPLRMRVGRARARRPPPTRVLLRVVVFRVHRGAMFRRPLLYLRPLLLPLGARGQAQHDSPLYNAATPGWHAVQHAFCGQHGAGARSRTTARTASMHAQQRLWALVACCCRHSGTLAHGISSTPAAVAARCATAAPVASGVFVGAWLAARTPPNGAIHSVKARKKHSGERSVLLSTITTSYHRLRPRDKLRRARRALPPPAPTPAPSQRTILQRTLADTLTMALH